MSGGARVALALGLAAACLLWGCQTERDGVYVDLSAALRAYRARVDRQPGRQQVERILASLSAQQLTDLGVLYERGGRLEEAAWAYQQAVWRDPRYSPAYVNLGNVRRAQGRHEEALFRYRQAMAADPHSFIAANNFADLCAHLGLHLDEAVARLTPLLEEAGVHRAHGLDTLGWLHHLRGDHERAAALLERAAAEAEDPDLLAAVTERLAVLREALARCGQASPPGPANHGAARPTPE